MAKEKYHNQYLQLNCSMCPWTERKGIDSEDATSISAVYRYLERLFQSHNKLHHWNEAAATEDVYPINEEIKFRILG